MRVFEFSLAEINGPAVMLLSALITLPTQRAYLWIFCVLFSAAVRVPSSVNRNKLIKFGDYVAECLPKYVQQVSWLN